MKILEAVQQTARRAGGAHTRQRGTEAFDQAIKDWSVAEHPQRVLRRMEQLGLQQEARKLARSMSSGKDNVAFNPLERIIGQSQLMSSFFLPLGAERTRAVGRIVTPSGKGIGTGFLISSKLLMTNNHVIENERNAAACSIEFDYVCRFDGGFSATQVFRLLPGEFFLTSVTRNELNLDYTIVAVEPVNSRGEELAGRGSIPLVPTMGDLTVLEWANIIQHPGGDPQQVALRDNKVVKSLEHFIHYEADTQPGSSGSPVFNDQWQLAALHHSGVPDEKEPGVYRLRNGGEWDARVPQPYVEQLQMWAKVNWLSNEGVRINSIIMDARSRLQDDPVHLALFNEAVGEYVPAFLERTLSLQRGEAGQPTGAASTAEDATEALSSEAAWLIQLPGEKMIITKPNGWYECEKELGKGTFGVTYLARDAQVHSRYVVIKLLLDPAGRGFDDPSFKEMFERETKALAQINDLHVVRIDDYGWMPDGRPFIVMQHVEGKTLRAVMDGQAMKPQRAARIVSQLAGALSAVHNAGVVHRDLKPENVMIQSSFEEESAILIDFGVAKVDVTKRKGSPATGSTPGSIAGTPVYMAPEQLRGHPVFASDVWALGVVAYELVTGRRPFSVTEVDTLDAVSARSFPKPRDMCPELSEAAEVVILKALSYEPADRYQQAHEMGQAFLQAVREPVREPVREDIPPPVPSPLVPFVLSDPPKTIPELLQRCQVLFKPLEEFRDPESLNAFLSMRELRSGQKCVGHGTRLEFDQLLVCLYSSGRYRGQALNDVLSELASRYKEDHRGEECEQLKNSLSRLLKQQSTLISR
jgi:serine/threonine protein kinase/V8-like Glu-specific endopeptidase